MGFIFEDLLQCSQIMYLCIAKDIIYHHCLTARNNEITEGHDIRTFCLIHFVQTHEKNRCHSCWNARTCMRRCYLYQYSYPQSAIVPVTLFISYLNLFRHVRSESINFEVENFLDIKSSTKAMTITYLENLYIYSTM